MTLSYEPTTAHGAGFFPLLARMLQFSTAVHAAIGYEWPITSDQIRANLQRVTERAHDLSPRLDMFSEGTQKAYRDWVETANKIVNDLTGTTAETPVTEPTKLTLRSFAQQTWAFMTVLDTELFGLTNPTTDPGREP
jgi:hypothetical protein